jgi:hypothetical protein
MANIGFDDSQWDKGFKALMDAMKKAQETACEKICDEVLRLGTFEVPFDKGMLQSSGMHIPTNTEGERIVGYNKVYAARLHEHPEYHFQRGRKGKYLIDPIMHNLDVFNRFVQNEVARVLQ